MAARVQLSYTHHQMNQRVCNGVTMAKNEMTKQGILHKLDCKLASEARLSKQNGLPLCIHVIGVTLTDDQSPSS